MESDHVGLQPEAGAETGEFCQFDGGAGLKALQARVLADKTSYRNTSGQYHGKSAPPANAKTGKSHPSKTGCYRPSLQTFLHRLGHGGDHPGYVVHSFIRSLCELQSI
jgi:hypothetical protein